MTVIVRRRVLVALGNPAWMVVGASLALTLLGLYAIKVSRGFSSVELAELTGVAETTKRAGIGAAAFGRQAVFAAIGLVAAAVIAVPNYRRWGVASGVLAAITVGLLIFLLIPWVPTWLVRPKNGARGWIDFGVADFQPAEIAKIVYVLVIAWYLRYRETHRRFWGLLPIGLMTMVPVGLISLQPDLGSALLFVPSLFTMLVAAGTRLRHLVVIVLVGAMAAPLAYPILLPHQKQRLVGLWKQFTGDTTGDRDINFQSNAAQTLIGAGGGVGVSTEKSRALLHFNALPERHNDMITAVIGNRFGMLGLGAVLALYGVWVVGTLWVAGRTGDAFGRLIPVGLAGFVGGQALINVAMNVGLAPIVGVTLPFVSYGGSSMLSAWAMTGLVVCVSLRGRARSFKKAFEYDEG
jgi:cell division protein FtsW (lipid II flippase)